MANRPHSPPLHTNNDPNVVLPYFRSPGELPSPLRYPYYDSAQITERLARTVNASKVVAENVWAVSFQPCLSEKESSEDRSVVQHWDGRWTFAAVFDGHGGPETADNAVTILPKLIKKSLYALLDRDLDVPPTSIAKMLAQAIEAYDVGLTRTLQAIFPLEKLSSMSDEALDRLVNDHLFGGTGEIHEAVLRCMRGTTAVILLVDRKTENMWTAGLGDSEAVLASDGFFPATATRLTAYHNGTDAKEVELIKAAHPGEHATSVFNSRVLGAIAVTRALGDHEFKLPAIYIDKVFLRAREPGFASPSKVQRIMLHSHTPPYLSAEPDVQHHHIRMKDKYVLLCSDGLRDLWDYEMKRNAEKDWVDALCGPHGDENLALRVLRLGLGGEDAEKCSMLMGLQLEEKWMDDVTIVVVALH